MEDELENPTEREIKIVRKKIRKDISEIYTYIE